MTTQVASFEEVFIQKSHSRIATTEDLHSIVSFINRAFLEGNPFMLEDRVDLDEIRDFMQKGSFLLLEDAGKIFAVIYAEIRGLGRGYLGLLVIDPEKRRSGVGRDLLLSGEDFCRRRGCSIVEGTVINRRPDLLERYKRQGWRVIGETPGSRTGCVQGGYSLILIEKNI
jgi:GNAT superfamily N-acetyltransferase